jgi:uncharacterized protein YjbI with pentapeptide repeats
VPTSAERLDPLLLHHADVRLCTARSTPASSRADLLTLLHRKDLAECTWQRHQTIQGLSHLTRESALGTHAPDVQAALTVFSSRRWNLFGDLQSDLAGVRLADADLHDADLTDADLTDADLHNAILYDDAKLDSVFLDGAFPHGQPPWRESAQRHPGHGSARRDPRGRGPARAQLGSVELRSAVPLRVTFGAANLVGADLRGALVDSSTAWPPGFDPKVAGVRMMRP